MVRTVTGVSTVKQVDGMDGLAELVYQAMMMKIIRAKPLTQIKNSGLIILIIKLYNTSH